MNVLHLISSSGFFGAERVVCELCCCSETMGLATRIAVLTRNESLIEYFKETVSQPNESVTGVACEGRLDISAIRALRRMIKDWNIDILHCHGYKSNFYAAFLKYLTKCPILIFSTNHNWIGFTLTEKVYQALDGLIMRCFDQLIAVSERVKEDMIARRIPAKMIKVVHNGIDPEDPEFLFDSAAARLELGMGVDEIVIGNVARLTAEKAHADLINAVAILRNDYPTLRLVVIGDGPDRQKLEALVNRNKMHGIVQFTGCTEKARRFYSAFDIFVLPSENEGLPMVLLEAMAAEVPVVASAVGAVPRVIKDFENGLLVTPKNVDQLAGKLRFLLEDPIKRKIIARNGKRTVKEKYSRSLMAQRYYKLYVDAKSKAV